MPPPRNLTGQRFGHLTVIRSDGRIFWGREQTAWLCRCDCGSVVRVAQARLTTGIEARQYHGCDICRSTPCVICEAPIIREANAKTCSEICAREHERRYQLEYYHAARVPDPDDTEKRRARRRAKWASLTPDEKREASRARAAAEPRESINARARARHAVRMMTDPEYAESKRLSAARHAEADPEAAREYQREHARKRRGRQAEIEITAAIGRLKID